jgi:hypothetical protein
MKRILITGLMFITATFVVAQNKDFPVFNGPEGSFANYFLESFFKMQKTTENICDTSLGFVEFHIDKDGHVISVLMPSNFPAEIAKIIEPIVRNSVWAPVKGRKVKDMLSIPIVLPLYISIETGCEAKAGDIKSKLFGLDKDFRLMYPGLKEKTSSNRFVLKPIAHVVPAGFQDLNPKN